MWSDILVIYYGEMCMYCVIVGDIVNSRDMDSDVRRNVTKAAKNIFDRINTDYSNSIITEFGMVRGDAFEGVMLTQFHAPKIVQDIIKALYRIEKTKVRISVVLGQLSIIGNNRNETDGPAFYTAFDRLEDLKVHKSEHWLQVSFNVGELAQSLVDGHLALLTALTEGWTDRQHEIVWMYEAHGGQQSVVARILDIPSSVVSKQLKAANYEAYKKAWDGLTDYLANMDYYTGDKTIVEKSYVPYYNMAKRENTQHNYEESLALLEEALKIAKDELGEKDPLLIQIYNELADKYLRLGNLNKSEAMIRNALQLQDAMPKFRLQYVETLLIQGTLFGKKGYGVEAQAYLERALSIAKDTVSGEHPFLAKIYSSLAVLFLDMKDYDHALFYLEKEYAISTEIMDMYPVEHAVTLRNIALCHNYMGNYAQAIVHIKNALNLLKDNLPANHREIINAQNLLSDLKLKLGGENI